MRAVLTKAIQVQLFLFFGCMGVPIIYLTDAVEERIREIDCCKPAL
jgi:hypothetical protein